MGRLNYRIDWHISFRSVILLYAAFDYEYEASATCNKTFFVASCFLPQQSAVRYAHTKVDSARYTWN